MELKALESEEIRDIAAWVMETSPDITVDESALDAYVEQHRGDRKDGLHDRAGRLIGSSIDLRPLLVPESPNDRGGINASLLFGLRVALRFMAVHERMTPLARRPLEVLTQLSELASSGAETATAIAEILREMMPEDSWSGRPSRGAVGAGLRALVGVPTTGVSPAVRAKFRAHADTVCSTLRSLGFEVLPPVFHPVGQDCSGECCSDGNVDLFVIIYTQPATRVGHQLAEVSGHLGVSFVAIPADLPDFTCLLKTPEHGYFVPVRFDGTVGEVVRKLTSFVDDNIGVLRARSEMAEEVSARLAKERRSLRDAILPLLDDDGELLGGFIPKSLALRVVSSDAAFLGASKMTIGALTLVAERFGRTAAEFAAADVFTAAQIYELDSLIENGEINAHHRQALLVQAAAVLHHRPDELSPTFNRSRTFNGPDDWIFLDREFSPHPRRD